MFDVMIWILFEITHHIDNFILPIFERNILPLTQTFLFWLYHAWLLNFNWILPNKTEKLVKIGS
jgi:hypothetical protein